MKEYKEGDIVCWQYRVQNKYFQSPEDKIVFYPTTKMDGGVWIFGNIDNVVTSYEFPIVYWRIKKLKK